MALVSALLLHFPYFQTPWQPQTVLSFFYPLILCVLGLRYLPSNGNSFWNIISLIGKASYHIFLIQIIFFGAGFSITSIIASSGLQGVYNTYILGIIALASNITITLLLGLLFYYIEPKLIKKVELQSLKLNKVIYRIIPKI
jgi:peptidoglycan/LPS O-acetylase OafA/YrhL